MPFIKRHPVFSFYALAFLISWSAMLLVIGGPGGLPGTSEQFERLFPLVIAALMAGPSVSGLLLTGIVSGRPGLLDLIARSLRWRVSVLWYAVALLTAPTAMTVVLLSLSLYSTQYLPQIIGTDEKALLLMLAVAAGLAGGFLEELGWTGFATPRLRQRHDSLATGFAVGVLWGVWHFLVNVWSSGSLAGGLSLAAFLPVYLFAGVAQLTAYRVLMVWVYDRTGSLLVAALMHASLIVSTVAVLAPASTGAGFLTWFLGLTIVLWVVVGAVLLTGDRRCRR